mgnify:CR=1 FL=1
MSPIAPFYSEVLFKDLQHLNSVHLADFPGFNPQMISVELEIKMSLAQKISSLILRLRKKTRIKVRQPLHRVLIPSIDDNFEKNIESKESDFFCVVEIKLCKIDWLFLKREGHRRANIFLNDKKEDLWVSP